MYFEFEGADGVKTTIDCADDGTVVYCVGKRRTKFNIKDCADYEFTFLNGPNTKLALGKDGVELMHLIMLKGEDRLAGNNDERESDEQSRFEHPDLSECNIADKDADTEKSVINRMDREELHSAISKLNPIDQQIARLFWIDGFKQSEIAKALEMTGNAVQLRSGKIVKKLLKLLQRQ